MHPPLPRANQSNERSGVLLPLALLKHQSLVLQRDFILQRNFGYYYETLRLRRFVVRFCKQERVRLACEQ